MNKVSRLAHKRRNQLENSTIWFAHKFVAIRRGRYLAAWWFDKVAKFHGSLAIINKGRIKLIKALRKIKQEQREIDENDWWKKGGSPG